MPKDNFRLDVKIHLRKILLGALGCHPSVLDCYAGSGKIYESCYRDGATRYVGLGLTDLPKVKPPHVSWRVDNRDWVRRNDLNGFNFFDLDAYGSAWPLVFTIAERLGDAPVAMALTDGSAFCAQRGYGPELWRALGWLPRGMDIPSLQDWWPEIMALAVRHLEEISARRAERIFSYGPFSQAGVVYVGLLLSAPTGKKAARASLMR
jgi:hypothetical protein